MEQERSSDGQVVEHSPTSGFRLPELVEVQLGSSRGLTVGHSLRGKGPRSCAACIHHGHVITGRGPRGTRACAVAGQMPGNCCSEHQQDRGIPLETALREASSLLRTGTTLAPLLHTRAREGRRWMTFRIERSSDGARSTIRLVGSVKSEDLSEIAQQLAICGPGAALDLEGVTVVGVNVIHFLGERERQGTELLHCPAYVREWISREGEQDE